MTIFDGRKLTERRIAMLSLILSLILGLPALIYSCSAYSFSKRSFCFEKVGNKLEQMRQNSYDLPKLLAGCGISPKDYCKDARSKISQTKNLCFDVKNALSDGTPAFTTIDNLFVLLDEIETDLKNESSRDKLISNGDRVNKLRASINAINLKDLECSL